ncbi:hypothetical protein ACFUGD_01265 [Streptomyces sp. NPDC057217]|uniref:hypothetical protein n=1 Tax=Streptomyces sp. NPDC057217 TaxID=3346054 RepID=UPI0036459514
MTFGELRRLLNTMPLTADDDPVMFLDVEAAYLYDIERVHHDDVRHDDPRTEGGTVMIFGHEH